MIESRYPLCIILPLIGFAPFVIYLLKTVSFWILKCYLKFILTAGLVGLFPIGLYKQNEDYKDHREKGGDGEVHNGHSTCGIDVNERSGKIA